MGSLPCSTLSAAPFDLQFQSLVATASPGASSSRSTPALSCSNLRVRAAASCTDRRPPVARIWTPLSSRVGSDSSAHPRPLASPCRPRAGSCLCLVLVRAKDDCFFIVRKGCSRGKAQPASLPVALRPPNWASAHYLRFCSGVVRIRSSTSVCLLHGLVLFPCGIS
uniref:Uncharacterized protein n=1 Tax=Triticum urartu TaxID=4572 RepID=A0A8R7R1H8_TRIUA